MSHRRAEHAVRDSIDHMVRRLVVLAAALALALGMGGCGAVRLETQDPPAATPDAVEQQRQALAEQAERLAVAAEEAAVAPGADAAVATVLAEVSADARTHLEILGGVWYPGGRHLTPLPQHADAERVLGLLVETAQQTRELAVTADGDLAPFLVGVTVSRLLRADQLAVALGSEPGAVEAALPTALDPVASADLVRTHDALGQAWETLAAREDGDARAEAAGTAARWRASAQELAALAGVADTADDPRLVTYALGTDPSAAVDDLMRDLVDCWLAQVTTTTGEDRERVIDQALEAARAAGLGQPGAEVPEVPGLVVDA